MSDWQTCFKLEEGKTYRIRYIWPNTNGPVMEGTYTFHGEVSPGNRAVVVMDPNDKTSSPGHIIIVEIEEQAARGEIHV